MHKSLISQSYLYFVIYLAFTGMFSCSRHIERPIPDVSHIILDSIHIERFDRDLQKINEQNAATFHQDFKTRYGHFYEDYIEQILKIGSVGDDSYIEAILPAISSQAEFQQLADTIALVFPNLEQQEEQLTDAFKRVRHYLPENPIPARIIAFFSGFAVQIPIGADYMGIGLDLFLGENSTYYPDLAPTFPRYMSAQFTPGNIVPRLMMAYIQDACLAQEPTGGTFLDLMLYHGKALYLMDLFLPFTPDRLKMGYTDRQHAWAVHFQHAIWDWMIDEQMLFLTDVSLHHKHFGEAPFTAELGEHNDSAPKLGAFMGWQMVRKYMQVHPKTTVQELIEYADSQTFLQEANYQGDFRTP